MCEKKSKALSSISLFAFVHWIGYVWAMPLQRLNWNQRNYEALNDFLADVRPGELAVFDWDNTCICGDIGEAIFRYQALHLKFKFNPEQLRAIIPDQVHGIDHINVNGQPIPLPQVKGQIVSAYEKIFDRALTEIRASAAHRDFSAGLLALNRGLEETPGIGCEFAYPWIINFLQGFSPAEVYRLAIEVIDSELQSGIENRTMSDSREQLLYHWTAGIRCFPEMADLARILKKAGCRVIVSTASNPLIIETMMQRTGFAAELVIGMASGLENGILQGTLAPGLAPNFGPGKVENMCRLLDQEPVFAAGDSSGDYEIMTAFPGTRLKLLIRRRQPEKMVTLYKKALAGDRQYLLQDVDLATGQFLAAVSQPAIAV
jgi:phosphoserine phosphatase